MSGECKETGDVDVLMNFYTGRDRKVPTMEIKAISQTQYKALLSNGATGSKGVSRCPVPHLVGVPLCIQHVRKYATHDNHQATWLMVDPDSGFAPPPFATMGECTVFRGDGKNITIEQVSDMTDFIGGLLDYSWEDGRPTKRDFDQWLAYRRS